MGGRGRGGCGEGCHCVQRRGVFFVNPGEKNGVIARYRA